LRVLQATPKARSRPGVRRVLACLTAAAAGLLAAALVLRILWLRGPSGGGGAALRSADNGVSALDECLLGGRAGKRERLFLFVGAHGSAEAANWALCGIPHVKQDAQRVDCAPERLAPDGSGPAACVQASYRRGTTGTGGARCGLRGLTPPR
jgi:hypothetical protein